MSIEGIKPEEAAVKVKEELARWPFPYFNRKDPEEVTKALQNIYNLSDSDADELGLLVWELL